MGRLRATFVVPWYGEGVPGGAEAEARRTAEELVRSGVEVHVLASTLKGLGSDWASERFPAGVSTEKGVVVHRFEPDERKGEVFAALNARVVAMEPLGPTEEEALFANMLPCSGLMEFLAANPELGPFFFIPYLVTTTVMGVGVHPSQSVIIPCLHDEGYARLGMVRRAFELAREIVFHVPAERRLAQRLYKLKDKGVVLGEGVDTGWKADPERFRQKYGIDGPFVLYAGRKDAGKNVPLLVSYFARYASERGGAGGLKLVTIGNLPCPMVPGAEKWVVDLGYVPLQDKYDAYAAAEVLVQPSLMESFSLVIMEAWLAGTPVLVHGGCEVTREHVETCGGGLYFTDYPSFAEALDLMLARAGLRERMASAGREYVVENYSWDVVIPRYVELIQRISASGAPSRAREPAPPGPRPTPGRVGVHQVLVDLAWADAIGSEVLAIAKALRARGVNSLVFARYIDYRLSADAIPIEHLPRMVGEGDILIIHFSIGHELCWGYPRLPGRKILRYHNITPAEFLAQANPLSAERARLGREQLSVLAEAVELGLGVSEFNCAELKQAGCRRVVSLPLVRDPQLMRLPPDEGVLKAFGDGALNVVHVGRVAPNKRVEELIKVHYWLERLVPGARLIVVGSWQDWIPYFSGLRRLARDLGVRSVHFTGKVPYTHLVAYYRVGGVYLCLSEHEGFCVPLVEAMEQGLPVVAYASTGIPGTLGDGGVLVEDKDPLVLAELVARIWTDGQVREELAQRALARARAFEPRRVTERLMEILRKEMGVEL